VDIDYGVVLSAAAALAFYFRLIRVQKRAERSSARAGAAPANLIKRWPPAAAGVLLAAAGAVLAGSGVAPGLQPWWWLPVTLGFAVLMLAV
jgi:hypothetical protein